MALNSIGQVSQIPIARQQNASSASLEAAELFFAPKLGRAFAARRICAEIGWSPAKEFTNSDPPTVTGAETTAADYDSAPRWIAGRKGLLCLAFKSKDRLWHGSFEKKVAQAGNRW